MGGGDVLDVIALENAMNGVDTIIHSAAIVSFATKDRKEMYQVNVEGTANVVNIALEKMCDDWYISVPWQHWAELPTAVM